MGSALKSLIFLVLILSGSISYAQQTRSVSDSVVVSNIEIRDNKLHISYDILHSQPDARFKVTLAVTDETGREIHTVTVEGDIGVEVFGGNNKYIVWDYVADQVEVKGDIIVVVEADPILPDPIPSEQHVLETAGSFKRSSLILQSLVFPGLGMTRLTGKPHWLRGVAAYGCVAGSIVLNKMAVSTYEDFPGANSMEEASSLYDKSKQQDNFSEGLAYAALGVWVVDFFWTLVGTSDVKKISMGTGFDTLSKTPMLALTYRF